jgi:hypothetical protein
VYVYAATFVSLWGYFQFLCAIIGVTYPAAVFNNGVLESMKGYEQVIPLVGRDIARVSSVAHEPSIFAKFLLTVFPVLLAFVLTRNRLLGPKADRLVLWIIIGALVVSTSSTAFVGILVASGLALFLCRRFNVVRKSWYLSAVAVVVVILVAVATIPTLQEVVLFETLSKGDSGSALERIMSITNSWSYFQRYPVLGVGWAMVTSHDLFVYLLATTGVVGLVTFFILMIYVVRRSLRVLSGYSSLDPNQPDVPLLIGLTVALVTSVIVAVITGLEFYLGYFYFVLALTIATNKVLMKSPPASGSMVATAAGIE